MKEKEKTMKHINILLTDTPTLLSWCEYEILRT